MRPRSRLPLVALVALVTALLATLLGSAPLPAVAAGGGGTLTVRLEVLNSPAWGEDLQVRIETNQPGGEGLVELYKIESNGSRTLLASPTEEGTFAVSTRLHLWPADHQLVATAIREGVSGESLTRVATITRRATTTSYLDTAADAGGTFRVRVSSGVDDLVPAGNVVFSGPTIVTQTRTLDATGVAVLDGLTPGSHEVRADYACSSPYLCSSATHTLLVQPYAAHAVAELSTLEVTAGAPFWVRLWIEGRSTNLPASGDWRLAARAPGGDRVPVAAGVTDGDGSFDVDLTDWANKHPGTWRLLLSYDGNGSIGALADTDLAGFTVLAARSATTTTFEPPATGVPVGGTVTVRATSTAGLPEGPVQLRHEDGRILATGTATAGLAVLTLPPALGVGTHRVRAEYAGSESHAPSTSGLATLNVVALPAGGPSEPTGPADPSAPGTPATPGAPGTPVDPGAPGPVGSPADPAAAPVTSRIGGRVVGKRKRAVLAVVVSASTPVAGRVQVRDGKRLVRTLTLTGGRARAAVRLRPGKHRLSVTYLGSSSVARSQRTWTVRVR